MQNCGLPYGILRKTGKSEIIGHKDRPRVHSGVISFFTCELNGKVIIPPDLILQGGDVT